VLLFFQMPISLWARNATIIILVSKWSEDTLLPLTGRLWPTFSVHHGIFWPFVTTFSSMHYRSKVVRKVPDKLPSTLNSDKLGDICKILERSFKGLTAKLQGEEDEVFMMSGSKNAKWWTRSNLYTLLPKNRVFHNKYSK